MDSKSTSRPFPGFDRLFKLGEPGNSRAFRGKIDVKRDEAFALTRAEMQPPHPITVKWTMGGAQPVEVIRTTLVASFIVADSVVQLLRTHGFTGWSLYEVSVHDKQGQLIPGYSGLAITGRCGNVDWSQSVEVPRNHRGGIFPVWKGFFFAPASWDGSDFFMAAGRSGSVLVVEAVKKAFERAKVRNVDFEPLDQYERSWRV